MTATPQRTRDRYNCNNDANNVRLSKLVLSSCSDYARAVPFAWLSCVRVHVPPVHVRTSKIPFTRTHARILEQDVTHTPSRHACHTMRHSSGWRHHSYHTSVWFRFFLTQCCANVRACVRMRLCETFSIVARYGAGQNNRWCRGVVTRSCALLEIVSSRASVLTVLGECVCTGAIAYRTRAYNFASAWHAWKNDSDADHCAIVPAQLIIRCSVFLCLNRAKNI